MIVTLKACCLLWQWWYTVLISDNGPFPACCCVCRCVCTLCATTRRGTGAPKMSFLSKTNCSFCHVYFSLLSLTPFCLWFLLRESFQNQLWHKEESNPTRFSFFLRTSSSFPQVKHNRIQYGISQFILKVCTGLATVCDVAGGQIPGKTGGKGGGAFEFICIKLIKY